jgi:hypothetical protein
MNKTPGIIQNKWQARFFIVLFFAVSGAGFLLDQLGDAAQALAAVAADDLRMGENLVANCVVLEQMGPRPAPTLEAEVRFCREFMGSLLADETWRGIDELVEIITGEAAVHVGEVRGEVIVPNA